MRQRLFVSAVFVLLTGACYAQWTKEDSLRLKKSLKEGEELKLNKEAVRQIDLNAGAANPRVYEEKRWMRFDESLPRVISPSAVVESDTLYDKRRITGGKLPLQMLEVYKPVYAHLPLDTLKIAMEFKLPPPEGISLGNGVRVNGGTFSGLDLLQALRESSGSSGRNECAHVRWGYLRNIENRGRKMSELIKRLITAMTLCLTALLVHAQEWTKEDSLRLRKLLDSDQELNLNQDAVRQIDFGSAVGTPRMSVEKKWMLPDESLPEALPKPKVVLSLMPYKANTPYNWDPVFQKKIRMDKNTWRGDPHYEMRHQRSYSNWARNPMAGGVRKSLEEIRASGVRFRQLSERANGMMVNSVVMDSPIPLFGGSGVYINGGTIGGLDLMAVFTKNFWDKKGKERRERTLEVLRTYGDSTTVLINRPIEQIAR